MSAILSLLLNAAVLTTPPAQDAKKVEATATQGAKADCDGKDKTLQALTNDPKASDPKAAEEKALQNMGLKKDEPKTKPDTVVTSAPAMETCK